jgi:hypothetical protein
MEARLRRERIFSKPFNGIDKALPNDTHAHQQEDEYHNQQKEQCLEHA